MLQALIAVLDAVAANKQHAREDLHVLLEGLQNCALEIYLRNPEQEQAAQRGLAVVGGRSEQAMWTGLMQSLSRYSSLSFNSLANKLLLELEASRDSIPNKSILYRCQALSGLQFPTTRRAAPKVLDALDRFHKLLTQSQFHSKLQDSVCVNLGMSLLDQCLASEAAGPPCAQDPVTDQRIFNHQPQVHTPPRA